MGHKKHKKKSTDAVELNLAAMLDMAFQLLAFFTITFKPAPVEVEIQMRLPKAVKTDIAGGRKAGEDTTQDDVIGKKTLVVTVAKKGDEDKEVMEGSKKVIRKVHVANYLVEAKSNKRGPFFKLDDLKKELQSILGDEGSGYEQIILQGGPDLQYLKVMEVVEMCSSIRMPDGKFLNKISIVSMVDSSKLKK